MTDKMFKEFIANSRYFLGMKKFVDGTKNLCPDRDKVFRFFNCDLMSAKCIILGMDPYHSVYSNDDMLCPVATGRAFEVANVDKWTDKYKQVSLLNIFKALVYLKTGKIFDMDELRRDILNIGFRYINIHDWFDAMEKEGVIFLNATLTTVRGKAGAHTDIWKDFMDELLIFINKKKQDMKWLIWGQVALNRVTDIVNKKNIIYSCHPATRINNTFVKDCTFKKVREINWV